MLKMLHDYVLVQAHEAKEETAGGIVLTAGGIDAPHTGTVVSVGPGKLSPTGERLEHGILEGDTIVFGASALNQPLKHDGVDYHVMLAEQVFGVDR